MVKRRNPTRVVLQSYSRCTRILPSSYRRSTPALPLESPEKRGEMAAIHHNREMHKPRRKNLRRYAPACPHSDPSPGRLVVLHKSGRNPIHLVWMVKEVVQLATKVIESKPHPACLDGESGWPAFAFPREIQTASFTHGTSWGSCFFVLSVLAIQPCSPSGRAGWGPRCVEQQVRKAREDNRGPFSEVRKARGDYLEHKPLKGPRKPFCAPPPLSGGPNRDRDSMPQVLAHQCFTPRNLFSHQRQETAKAVRETIAIRSENPGPSSSLVPSSRSCAARTADGWPW